MLSRALHIVACVLIVLLGLCERSVPCGDDHCDEPVPVEAALHVDHSQHDGQAPLDEPHHCDHCACLCHMAVLPELHSSSFFVELPERSYLSVYHFPPSASVDPLDHVPLA